MGSLSPWMAVLAVSALLFAGAPAPAVFAETQDAGAIARSEAELTEVLNTAFRSEHFGEVDGAGEESEAEAAVAMETSAEKPSSKMAAPACKCPKPRRRRHRGKKAAAAKPKKRHHVRPEFSKRDVDELNVLMNAEYLEAEFFLTAAYGYGLDKFNGTALNISGPPPVGAERGRMGRFVEHMAKEFGLQALEHIRAIQSKLGDKAIERPQMDLSRQVWGGLFNEAFGTKLHPSFDPYTSGNHFLLAAYVLPYVSYTAYVGLNMHVEGTCARDLVAGLAGVKAAQDASIRTVLYQRRRQAVEHYNMSVGDFTATLSALRRKLDRVNGTVVAPSGVAFTLPRTVDEGVLVPGDDTPERLLTGCIIPVNENSLSVGRTPEQMLQVLYGTGNASIPGMFFPEGANGRFATEYLALLS